MAILNKIRQKTVILILVIALALFAFILSSLFENRDALFSKSQNIVATINDKDITREDFMLKVEQLQRQMGPNATNTQVMNRVWDQEVRQAVLQNQFDALGLSVEKDQMRDLLKTALATNENFLNEAGLFDENKMNEYIANLKETSPQGFQSWINYEQQVAANALSQNYFNMVKAGLSGTIAEGKLEHELAGNKVDVKYVQINFATIPDSTVAVSKSDIKSYINANKNQYKVEASKDIRYVEFKEVASAADENAIKAELNNYIKGQLVDSRGAKDVITAFSKVTNNEEYINTIAASDTKFDKRFVFKSSLPTEAADAIYNLNEGEVYGPYKQNGSYKVTKVIAVKQIPDSAKVRHILIPFKGAQSAGPDVVATEVQAKTTADSLLAKLKVNRSKFPEFVTAFSSDQGSVEKGGRYDWHPYNTMVPEFNDFEFEGKTGDLGVVKTAFGFHIIEVEGQKNKTKAIQVGTISRKIEPSETTTDKVFRDASNFEIKAKEGDFEALAKEKNYSLRPVNGIGALDENIPGVGNQRPIVRWAFEKGLELGAIKRFNVPNGYVIAQLVANHEAGLMSADDATAKVLPLIRKEKKAKLIRDRVSATDLEGLAAAEKTNVRTATGINMKNPTVSGAGREPLLVGAAFGLKEGETSGLIDGANGVYMVKVTKVTPTPVLNNYQSVANRVEQQKAATVTSKLYNALKESADIEDNRVSSQVQ